MKKDVKIPSLSESGKNIPEAYYNAMEAVHNRGYELRTQYDRKDAGGNYIDPAGRDAKVFIEVEDLFGQPRHPVLSFSERGKYIAELLGAKDHLVVPYEELRDKVQSGEEFHATEWPYCYHQRLTAYPTPTGTINQLEIAVERLVKDHLSRRAVATTRLPEIDAYLSEDIPCLSELQFRAIEDGDALILQTEARWRSRDLYKAWGDNLIGLSHLIDQEVRRPLEEKTGRQVIMGPYTEENGSLHIYGQDYSEKGAATFFEQFPDAESFVNRAWDSDVAKMLILPELQDLKGEDTWKFPQESIELIQRIHDEIDQGTILA